MLNRTFICAASIPAPRPTNITGRPSLLLFRRSCLRPGSCLTPFLLSSSIFRVVLFSCFHFANLAGDSRCWSSLSCTGANCEVYVAVFRHLCLHAPFIGLQVLIPIADTTISHLGHFPYFPLSRSFFCRLLRIVHSAAHCFLFLDNPSLHFLLFLFLCLLRPFVYPFPIE